MNFDLSISLTDVKPRPPPVSFIYAFYFEEDYLIYFIVFICDCCFPLCAIFSSSARVNFIVAVAMVVVTTPDIYSFYLLSPVEFSMLIYFHFAKTLCLK